MPISKENPLVDEAGRRIREILLVLPDDNSRAEAIYAAGFCVHCGVDKCGEPCFCTNDE